MAKIIGLVCFRYDNVEEWGKTKFKYEKKYYSNCIPCHSEPMATKMAFNLFPSFLYCC